MAVIVILATLDTKLEEALFVMQEIESTGLHAQIVDCSLRAHAFDVGAISNKTVTESIGIPFEQFCAYPKDKATETMQNALLALLLGMHKNAGLGGVIAIGGMQGSYIAAKPMQLLDVGLPKLIVSAVANGQAAFGPFVGSSDMTIMHSVVDIAGMNSILKKVLRNAAAGICGMARAKPFCSGGKKTVGITMGGVTTIGAAKIIERLRAKGFETIVFHCNGIGAQTMEKLVEDGLIDCVLDLTPHDISDKLHGGLMPCHEDRLRPSVKKSVPMVFVPGGIDFILYNGVSKIPVDKAERPYVPHNSLHTHVRASYCEMYSSGKYVGERLSQAKRKTKILYPSKGLSEKNCVGQALYSPEADCGFLDGLAGYTADKNLELVVVDSHINDDSFCEKCVSELLSLYDEDSKVEQ